MRDALNNSDFNVLVQMVKAGAPWDVVVTTFPDLDPTYFERNKESIYKHADVALPKAAPVATKPGKSNPLE